VNPPEYAIVNYVIEGCPDGRPWITLQLPGDDQGIARQAYENWLAGDGSLNLRLVQRTAVITDVVVCAGRQGPQGIPGDEPEWWED
jgi:hypothetical protein